MKIIKKITSVMTALVMGVSVGIAAANPVRADAASAIKINAPVNSYKITSKFGWRTLNGKSNYHSGIDMVSQTGDMNVYAPADGEVTFSYNNCPCHNNMSCPHGSWGGNSIFVKTKLNNANYTYKIFHMEKGSVKFKKGDKVKAGQVLGKIGNSGFSMGKHCHLQLENKNGTPINVNPEAGTVQYTPIVKPDKTQSSMLKNGGVYRIETASKKGLYAGTKGNSTKSGTNVQFVSSKDSSSLWTAHYNPDTYSWYFTPKSNKSAALNLSADAVKSGTNANIYKYIANDLTQEFRLVKSGSSFLVKSAANLNVCLDAYGSKGTQKSGTNIHSWKSNGDVTQKWNFVQVS